METNTQKDDMSQSSTSKSESGSPPQEVGNVRVHGRPRMRNTKVSCEDDVLKVIHLRDTPSPINLTPWNNITLTFESIGRTAIHVASLFSQLRKQLDPNKHFLGKIKGGCFKSNDEEFDHIPLDLAIAHAIIEKDPAVQMRIRQIKVWAKKTNCLDIQILEPFRSDGEPQKMLVAKKTDGPSNEMKTFGCKLPQYMRSTIYYSLDYKTNQLPILNYATDVGATVHVQFNVEWKSMSCSRTEFANEIHAKRFEKELLARAKLPSPAELLAQEKARIYEQRLLSKGIQPNQDFSSPDDEKEVAPQTSGELQECASINAIPSKTFKEWKEDPIIKNYIKRKRHAVEDDTAQYGSEKPSTSNQRQYAGRVRSPDAILVPRNSVDEAQSGNVEQDALTKARLEVMDKAIMNLQIITKQLSDSSSKSSKSHQSGGKDEEI